MISNILEGTGQVFASDVSEKRLEKLKENLAGQSNVTVQCLDARTPTEQKFDAILLDVPCPIPESTSQTRCPLVLLKK